jgi:cyclopropane fatty-acyl-phospholipid synthase-like methyltransferase
MSIINSDYQAQLSEMHGKGQFVRGGKLLKSLNPFLKQYQPGSVLDYGCGHGGLMAALKDAYPTMQVEGYDPGNLKHSRMPKRSFDAVISGDVFEHIEPEYLDATLQLIDSKILRCGWFRIACYPAKKHLPDGRNAHLIIEPPDWWRNKILTNMQVTIVQEDISVFDKSRKWPGIVGYNYDVLVAK